VQRAAALSEAGRQWLLDLPATLAGLEDRWGVQVGEALSGGTASYVALGRTATGDDVVLKVALPPGIEGHASFEAELVTLLAGGPGYVRLLAHDVDARALLTERLGEPLTSHGLCLEGRLACRLHREDLGDHGPAVQPRCRRPCGRPRARAGERLRPGNGDAPAR
jgi:hypothetical protein